MSNNQRHLIIVGGPTASGKTALAIRIAQLFGTEIISADSRQFYREMTIGTAKPSAEELASVKHHFINSLSVIEDYSAGDFERESISLINQLHQTHPVVVVAGGSGLFINAISQGLDHFPDIPIDIKKAVDEGEKSKGLSWLQTEVRRLDPTYYKNVDPMNPARLRRALEVSLSSGKPYSSFLGQKPQKRPFMVHYLLLHWPRELLYQRINRRVDQMISSGLEEEVAGLLDYKNRPALRTVGYEEWFPYFEGQSDKNEIIDKIKQHTRNYAKRQDTWFRKHGEWKTINPDNFALILHYLEETIK